MVFEPKELLRSALGLAPNETPFPWQEWLLARMLKGDIPELIDIPKGLGRTSVLAFWLVRRVCGGPVPRRLVYIVDRRAVFDQAIDEATRLREWVDEESSLKKALRLNDRALPISTLRAGYVDNREWLEDPAAPSIMVGTVDMVGSRLLFEVPRPIHLSGWDMAASARKPSLHIGAPGAVYLFERAETKSLGEADAPSLRLAALGTRIDESFGRIAMGICQLSWSKR